MTALRDEQAVDAIRRSIAADLVRSGAIDSRSRKRQDAETIQPHVSM